MSDTLKDSSTSTFPSYLALGIGILSLGFSAIFVRWADAPGPVASFYRMAIPVVLLAWPFYRRVKTRGRLPRRGLQFAVLGGLFFAADMAFWASGVVMSGATNPTLLANTAPLWVGLARSSYSGKGSTRRSGQGSCWPWRAQPSFLASTPYVPRLMGRAHCLACCLVSSTAATI